MGPSSAPRLDELVHLELRRLGGGAFLHVRVLGPLSMGVFNPYIVVGTRIVTRAIHLLTEFIHNVADMPIGGCYDFVWRTSPFPPPCRSDREECVSCGLC